MRSYCTHTDERIMSANVPIRGRTMSAFINALIMRLHCDPSAPVAPILRPYCTQMRSNAPALHCAWRGAQYDRSMSTLRARLRP